MRFHLKLCENQLDPVAGRGREHPHAVLEYGTVQQGKKHGRKCAISSRLLGRVVVWKVRAGQLSLGGGDLVLAAALLAVVLVVVQDEA